MRKTVLICAIIAGFAVPAALAQSGPNAAGTPLQPAAVHPANSTPSAHAARAHADPPRGAIARAMADLTSALRDASQQAKATQAGQAATSAPQVTTDLDSGHDHLAVEAESQESVP